MSTITKILKTAGVSALCNGVSTSIIVNNYPKDPLLAPKLAFTVSTLLTTLPALLGVSIDKFVNQKFTSNKTTQYWLTALESFVTTPTVLFLYDHKNKFLKYYKNIFSVLSVDVLCKSFTLSTMVQSLAFKYIWDSNDATNPEIEQQTDLIEIV